MWLCVTLCGRRAWEYYSVSNVTVLSEMVSVNMPSCTLTRLALAFFRRFKHWAILQLESFSCHCPHSWLWTANTFTSFDRQTDRERDRETDRTLPNTHTHQHRHYLPLHKGPQAFANIKQAGGFVHVFQPYHIHTCTDKHVYTQE